MQAAMQRRTMGARPSAKPSVQTSCVLRVRPFSAASIPRPSVCSRRDVAIVQRVVFARSTEKPAHPFPEEEDFDLLSNKIADMVPELNNELKGCSIYLIGMMGSGKSTVGKMLANTLKYAFFDTDTMVEMAHEKKAVSEIFKEYGEDYFRNCESEVLKQLAPYKNLVVATGGGAVIKPMNWSYMHSGVVAWLNGPTDLLARRVSKDGLAKRPLLVAGTDGDVSEEQLYATAKEKIEKLLADRTKYYETADLKISLEGYGLDEERGAPSAVVMYRLLCALKQKIEDTKREREERRNFTIENAGDVPSMRVKESPAQPEEDKQ
uniref:shikimate kinase n=1 Tax=Chlamydomonas leiostraca TaxID=1034604 RepID=A0A7S0WF86_9CHLO|mmetsp:Transcript_12297/g.30057  ORF Transcript_12297/g.30057 Transcript_12297/m.30057 type:complete len:321 (+) Transcript_12297:2-964(+)